MKIPFVSSYDVRVVENRKSDFDLMPSAAAIHQKPINILLSKNEWVSGNLKCEFWVTKMPETLVKDPTAKSIKTF